MNDMGPLTGVKIVELAGLGAAPYGCMMMADMGADVVRIQRLTDQDDPADRSPLLRNRRSLALDLKHPGDRDLVLALIDKADVMVEAFRPGVAERLGVGPDTCLGRNTKLVYARMTGWGQTGPLAQSAGHDLNYISVAGVLHQIGPMDGKPTVPLNLIGDFGGGGLLMAFGVMCALWESRKSGQGQVVDAAMVDGTLSFMAMFFGDRAQGRFTDRTGGHFLGGGAHYYDTYETADGRYLAVAPIEPQFYRSFLRVMGLEQQRWIGAGYPKTDQHSASDEWIELKAELTALFKCKTREEWCAQFNQSDVCVTPVLTLQEAQFHPHNQARNSFIEVDGVVQNAPAPRFSRTPAAYPTPPSRTPTFAREVLLEWGVK